VAAAATLVSYGARATGAALAAGEQAGTTEEREDQPGSDPEHNDAAH
jgi:hypothetical protein